MSVDDEPKPPLLGISTYDAGLDRQLRRNLTTLRDKSRGKELAGLLDDVLAGRRSLREVARTPEWNDAVAPAARQMAQQWAGLTPTQREEIIAQGQHQLEVERRQAERELQERPPR